jgi:hypothetical protein
MKNIKLVLTFLLIAWAAMSCRKEEDPGGVAIGDMCGEWHITVDGAPKGTLITSNNVNNDANKLVISDKLNYYWFNVEVDLNLSAQTFSVDTAMNQEYYNASWNASLARTIPYDIKIVVRNGKVTKGAVTLPSGVKADLIEFQIGFEDDGTPYELHQIVGYRRSGFLEDETFVYAP